MNLSGFIIIVAIVPLLISCGNEEGDVADFHLTRQASESKDEVQLASSKKEYLLGEPVLLTVKLNNPTNIPIETYEPLVQRTQPEIRIWISDGGTFHRYKIGLYGTLDAERNILRLKPGESKTYELKVLYASQEASKLAFGKTGSYGIRIEYPMRVPVKPTDAIGRISRWKGSWLPSNTIAIRVKQPRGEDAKIWRKINQPSVLRFLQSGELGTDEEDIPVELADLVEKFPKSGYAESLKHALRWYYDRQMRGMTAETLKSDPWMQRLRQLLDIELNEDRGLFPDDRRLDVKIKYHYPTPTPWQKVFDEVSEQADVSLRLDPDLRVRTSKGLPITETLREFMQNKAAYKAKWIQDGDGYKLVPETEVPQK